MLGAVAAGDNVGAAHATRCADEPQLEWRDPELVRPSVDVLGCQLDVVTAATVLAEHIQITRAR